MVKVHRAYRHRWWHPSKEITERDYQAMCNFADNDVSCQALAEYFGCSAQLVSKEIVLTDHYGYRLRQKSINASAWGAGPDALSTFLKVLQAPRSEMTWQEYLDTVDWNDAYERWGDDAREHVMQRAIEIAEQAGIELTFV